MNDGRTVLILGALHGQAEIMERLRARGWTVHACGHERSGPGVETADEFHTVDIVDVDAVEALARTIGADIVYSVGSDIAMPTVAAVSERLGLPNFHPSDLVDTLHRKTRLREFLNRHDLGAVEFQVVRAPGDLGAPMRFPAIVKPSDSQGQRGITIVADRDEAVAAIEPALAASRSSTAIVEELLDGPEISVHVVVVDGEIVFQLASDRIVWDGPAVGIPAGHTIPATFLTPPDVGAVDRLIAATVAALDVTTGPLYFQLKLTSVGPRIVEIAPRLDGCHLWRLIELSTGFNIVDRLFDLLAGSTWVPVTVPDHPLPVHLEFFLADPALPVRHADWQDDDPSVLHCELQVADGHRPRATNPHVARLGYRIRRLPG